MMQTEPHITREEAKECVGAGWSSLVNEVYDKLPERVIVVQVKEKLGGLRIYVEYADLDFLHFLVKIENRSLETCERCGEAGETRAGGWLKTLCDSCASS